MYPRAGIFGKVRGSGMFLIRFVNPDTDHMLLDKFQILGLPDASPK